MDILKRYAFPFLVFASILLSAVILLVSAENKGADSDSVSKEVADLEQGREGYSQPPIEGMPKKDSGNTDEGKDILLNNLSVVYKIERETAELFVTSLVNVREFPSVEFDRIGSLNSGDRVEQIGVCDNGWYLIEYCGRPAFIQSSCVVSIEDSDSIDHVYDGFILSDGDVPNKWLHKLDANYLQVPSNVREHFESSGWKIICTAEHLGTKFYNDTDLSIQAVNVTSSKEIWVEARDSAMESIVHEVGHYIDFNFNWVSSSEEFIRVYSSEVEAFRGLITTHESNTSSTSEYFAEAYSVSLMYADLMQLYCPKTYEFVMRYSSNL